MIFTDIKIHENLVLNDLSNYDCKKIVQTVSLLNFENSLTRQIYVI